MKLISLFSFSVPRMFGTASRPSAGTAARGLCRLPIPACLFRVSACSGPHLVALRLPSGSALGDHPWRARGAPWDAADQIQVCLARQTPDPPDCRSGPNDIRFLLRRSGARTELASRGVAGLRPGYEAEGAPGVPRVTLTGLPVPGLATFLFLFLWGPASQQVSTLPGPQPRPLSPFCRCYGWFGGHTGWCSGLTGLGLRHGSAAGQARVLPQHYFCRPLGLSF